MLQCFPQAHTFGSIPPFTFFLWHFFCHFSGSPHLSFTLLPPSFHYSTLNWDKKSFLKNNAITSMDASHYACVSTSVCLCVCVCDTQRLRAQTLPGGKHGCSLLFLLLFQIMVCFINAMVICFPRLLWSLYLSKWRKAQRNTHWSKRLQRPRATQPVSTVSIFHECCWRKVAVGDLQQTVCSKQRSGNIAEPPVEWPGPCVAAWPTLFSLYAYLHCCFSLGWLIDTKCQRLNMLQNKLCGKNFIMK